MDLFTGFSGAHGTHGVPEQDPDSVKWNIKRSARTPREPVTLDLWKQHIAGTRPLGVIPIREDNSCSWGSIDIDDYETDILTIVATVERMNLPLVPCRSKSGGLHLFLFTTEPVPAAAIQRYLKEIAAQLGWANSEIFPKQTEIFVDRGDLGNWMVMPYFGGDFDGKLYMQRGLKKTGGEQEIEEFLAFAQKMRVTPDQLVIKKRRTNPVTPGGGVMVTDPNEPFADGPPCLQYLARGGIKPGGQNNTLMMMGIYFKKKDPMGWKGLLEQANHTLLNPPGATDALATVIRSLDHKDYTYTCKTEPMASHCNSQICRMRKHGVGQAGAFPIISGVSKLDTDPPVWFVDVEDRRLEMKTETLYVYSKFQMLCMDKLNRTYMGLKQADWLAAVGTAMQNINIIPSPPEVGKQGIFEELLGEFLTNRQRGESIEDILRGRPWEDQEAGRHYFQLKDLDRFIKREGGDKDLTRGQITSSIKKLGGDSKFLTIKKSGRNCWWVPSSLYQETEPSDPPPVKGVPI